MIKITRFNGTEFFMNADLIETVERTPDTVITSITGRKVLVKEKAEEVVERIRQYRREVGPAHFDLEGGRIHTSPND